MTDPRHPDELETRLRALSPRRPSPELRAQVLRQAAAGVAQPTARGWRLWDSWTFRWGWALGLAVMVVVGTLSERSFSKNRWGGPAPAVARDETRVPVSGEREAALDAALRIEKGISPSDAAALGGGDPNRCDQDRAQWDVSAIDAPHPGTDRSRGTRNRTTEEGRRFA